VSVQGEGKMGLKKGKVLRPLLCCRGQSVSSPISLFPPGFFRQARVKPKCISKMIQSESREGLDHQGFLHCLELLLSLSFIYSIFMEINLKIFILLII